MRIIGIDLGSKSVKAVELDSAFGRFEIHEYHEVKLEEGETPAQTAKRLISSLEKVPDRIAVSLRTHQSTFRNLHFPTRDRKAIQESLPFELEDELPFDLESIAYDSAVIQQGPSGTDLHVSATLQTTLATFLNDLIDNDIDPDLITSETWAYKTLLGKINKSNETNELDSKPILLIQVGHSTSTLYLHQNDKPVFTKELRWGGDDFTEAIAQVYGMSKDKAELTKHDHAFILTEGEKTRATADQITFSETLKTPFEELTREIRMANLASIKETTQRISKIYICGGGSLIPGFASSLGEIFQVPVENLKSLSKLQPNGPAYSDYADAVFALALGNAIALVGTGKNAPINIRKGDFAKKGASSAVFDWDSLKQPLMAVSSVLFCFILSLTVNRIVLSGKLENTNQQLKKSIRSFFPSPPSESALRNYINSPSMLKKTIDKELEKERAIQKIYAENAQSPLQYLKLLSQAIPESVVVDLVRYQVGAAPEGPYTAQIQQELNLSFLVRTKDTLNPLKKILESRVDDLIQGNPEEVTFDGGPKPGMKHFKTTFVGKPKRGPNG